ncbi:hypothetical protein KIPB_014382, partial [Kipferlia bialata]
AEIASSLASLSLPEGSVLAVRSSGVLEDGTVSSAAGQFHTSLAVPSDPESVISNVLLCWARLGSMPLCISVICAIKSPCSSVCGLLAPFILIALIGLLDMAISNMVDMNSVTEGDLYPDSEPLSWSQSTLMFAPNSGTGVVSLSLSLSLSRDPTPHTHSLIQNAYVSFYIPPT